MLVRGAICVRLASFGLGHANEYKHQKNFPSCLFVYDCLTSPTRRFFAIMQLIDRVQVIIAVRSFCHFVV
jgi:hypothetical protein